MTTDLFGVVGQKRESMHTFKRAKSALFLSHMQYLSYQMDRMMTYIDSF